MAATGNRHPLVRELLAGAGGRGIRFVKAEVLALNADLVRPLHQPQGRLRLISHGRTVEATIQLEDH